MRNTGTERWGCEPSCHFPHREDRGNEKTNTHPDKHAQTDPAGLSPMEGTQGRTRQVESTTQQEAQLRHVLWHLAYEVVTNNKALQQFLCFLALHFILQCQNKWAGPFPQSACDLLCRNSGFQLCWRGSQGSRKKSSRLPQQQGITGPIFSRSRGWGPGGRGVAGKHVPTRVSVTLFLWLGQRIYSENYVLQIPNMDDLDCL